MKEKVVSERGKLYFIEGVLYSWKSVFFSILDIVISWRDALCPLVNSRPLGLAFRYIYIYMPSCFLGSRVLFLSLLLLFFAIMAISMKASWLFNSPHSFSVRAAPSFSLLSSLSPPTLFFYSLPLNISFVIPRSLAFLWNRSFPKALPYPLRSTNYGGLSTWDDILFCDISRWNATKFSHWVRNQSTEPWRHFYMV